MFRKINWGILIPVLILLAIGWILVLSSSTYYAMHQFSSHNRFMFVRSHSIYIALGLIVMFIGYKINYKIYDNILLVGLLAIFSIVLMLMTFMFDIGKEAHRWIEVGSLTFMPVDIAKIALIFVMAYSLSHFQANKNKIVALMIHSIFPGILLLITYFQPHFSSTMILSLTYGVLLFLGFTSPTLVIGTVAAMAAALGSAAWLMGYRVFRIESFTAGLQNIDDASEQVRYSVLAIASGGIFGIGPGKSVFNKMYIPEPHNDMIMSTLGEEFGLIGNLSVLILMFVLIWNLVRVANRSKTQFGMLVVYGIACIIFFQMVINMGTALGIMPPTGVPLPFISFGGTNILALMVLIGVALNVSEVDSVGD